MVMYLKVVWCPKPCIDNDFTVFKGTNFFLFVMKKHSDVLIKLPWFQYFSRPPFKYSFKDQF